MSYPDQTIAEYRQHVNQLEGDLFSARQALFTHDTEWRASFEVSESENNVLNRQVTILKSENAELQKMNDGMHETLLKYMDFIKVLQCEYERVRGNPNYEI